MSHSSTESLALETSSTPAAEPVRFPSPVGENENAAPAAELRPITLYEGKDSPGSAQQCAASFSELAAIMTRVERTDTPKLELAAWSPAKLTVPYRKNENVESVSCFVGDCDDISAEQWDHIKSSLAGLSWFYASSYSHQPISGKMRYRIVVELDRPVPAKDWRRFHRVMTDQLGITPTDVKMLRACQDESRLYFGPYCPTDGPEPESGIFPGIPLPVDDVLAETPEDKQTTPPPATEPKSFILTQGMVLGEVKRGISSYRQKIPRELDAAKRAKMEHMLGALKGLADALDSKIHPAPAYAVEGNRDNTLLLLSGFLEREFPGASPEEITAAIAEVLDRDFEAGRRPGARRDSEVLLAKLHRDRASREAEKEAKAQDLQRSAGREPYTEAEIDGWVKAMGLQTREELQQRLILNRGGHYYVFRAGTYDGPMTATQAETYAVQLLSLACGVLDVTVCEETREGLRHKSFKALARDYGLAIQSASKSLRASYPSLSYHAKRGYELCVPMFLGAGEDKPYCDPQLHRYLEIIAADKSQRDVLDHVLRVSHPRYAQNDSPTMLALEGPPKIGKSEIVAHGIGQQYSDVGCFNADKWLKSDFDDALTQSAVGRIDEGVSNNALDKLRSAITDTCPTINPKGEKPYKVTGGPYAFVAAVNDVSKLLAQIVAGELGNGDEVDSLVRRIVCVKIPDEAKAALLAEFGGSEGLHAFGVRCRTDRLIPRYIAWLQDRPVCTPDLSRSNERVRAGIMRAGGRLEALQACIRSAIERAQLDSQPECAGVCLFEGGVWLNARQIAKEWKSFDAFKVQPKENDIRREMEHLIIKDSAPRELTHAGSAREYRELDWGAFARELQHGGDSVDAYRLRVLSVSLWRAAQNGSRTKPEVWKPLKAEFEQLVKKYQVDGRYSGPKVRCLQFSEAVTTRNAAGEAKLAATPVAKGQS